MSPPTANIVHSDPIFALNGLIVSTPATSRRRKPANNGLCWQLLFYSCPQSLKGSGWLSIAQIRVLSYCVPLRHDKRFSLSCGPRHGVLHLETDCHGPWSAFQILSLPPWYILGGTFEDDAFHEGYDRDFLEAFCTYQQDRRRRSHMRSSSHDSLDSKSSGRSRSSAVPSATSSTGLKGDKSALMEVLTLSLSMGSDEALTEIRNFVGRHYGTIKLTRIDMELIARATGQFCYSACVSSPDDFRDDIMNATARGDTAMTYERFIDSEVDFKGRSEEDLEEKILFMDIHHISRYPFDGGARVSTSEIGRMITLVKDVVTATEPANLAAMVNAINNLIEAANEDAIHMSLAYDLVGRFGIDIATFTRRIWKILDINVFNSADDADAEAARLKAQEEAEVAASARADRLAAEVYMDF